jgi:protease-4
MKTFVLSFLGGLAALVMFFVLLPLVLILSFMPSGEPKAQADAVLTLDLRNAYPDQPAADSVSALFSSVSFVEILLRLNAAAEDPNVKGVFVRASEIDIGSSRAEELREAFIRLKASGKFVIAHSQGFLATGPSAYRAISAADEIWLQPGASFEVPGIQFETLFLGDAFRKFGVTAEIEQFYEFKNAADVYKQADYTPAHAEAMTALAESVWATSIADIAADRKLDAQVVRAALENSPYDADRAVALKLVDKVGWPEEAAEAAEARADDGELLPIENYAAPHQGGEAVVAIVGGEGNIVTGESTGGDLFSVGTPVFASDTIAANLLELADDADVDAVVFRVDSGGGSPTASDQIWRAVERLQEKGKKVVVSMGSMAASGGYYVATGADAIVSTRSTITGSIGVFGGKFAVADGLREYLGVNPASVGVGGEFAGTYSTEKLTDGQRAKLRASLEGVYQRFTTLVSEGRKLPIERVREIAKGRVWSGEDALKIGLVDETGDIVDAVNKAKVLAGFKPEDRAEIRLRIHEASPLELLNSVFVSSDGAPAAEMGALRALASIVGERRALGLYQQVRQVAARPGPQLYAPTMIER